MNTKQQTALNESKMKITAANLSRWAGLAAMAAGMLFVAVQLIHPPEVLSSVSTSLWAIVHYMTIAFCLLGLLGLTGIYARQAEAAGWLGLAGYLVFSLFLAITGAFVFVEAFVSPLLVTGSPKFVEGLLGIITGTASEINLGALPALYGVTGLFYLLGGQLFGIATIRAGILPRWAGVMFALGGPLVIVISLFLPHELIRLAAVPVGTGLVWLGYALWSERRAPVSEPVPGIGSPLLRQTVTE
jgi:hypothetical protein